MAKTKMKLRENRIPICVEIEARVAALTYLQKVVESDFTAAEITISPAFVAALELVRATVRPPVNYRGPASTVASNEDPEFL